MAKLEIHRRAIKLRFQRKSYSQIKQILGVSKSTLSNWLRAYPLTKEEIDNLRGKNEGRIEKYRQTMLKKRQNRLDQRYLEEKKNLLPLSKRELYLLGLFLYWGEGAKVHSSGVSLNNTDPGVVQFFLFWLTKIIGIEKKKIKVAVHLYSDMDINKSLNYWSKILNISRNQFIKPYVKKNKRSKLDQKGFGFGTCGLYIYNSKLKEKILAGIEVVKNYCQKRII